PVGLSESSPRMTGGYREKIPFRGCYRDTAKLQDHLKRIQSILSIFFPESRHNRQTHRLRAPAGAISELTGGLFRALAAMRRDCPASFDPFDVDVRPAPQIPASAVRRAVDIGGRTDRLEKDA